MRKFNEYTNIPVSANVRNALQHATILQVKFEDSAIRSAYFLIGAICQSDTIIDKFYLEKGLELEYSQLINSLITEPAIFEQVFGEEFCKYFFEIEDKDEQNDGKEELKKNSDEEKEHDTNFIIRKNVEEYVENMLNEHTQIEETQQYLSDISISFSISLYEALENASIQCKKTNSKILTIDPVLYCLFKIPDSSAYKLMKLIIEQTLDDVTIDEFISYIENNCNIYKETGESKKSCYIPSSLENCCEILNNKYEEGQKCEILCREKEIEQLWSIISKKTKRNAILVGKPGVGKTAIVEALTQQIVNKECPKEFLDYIVINFDTDSLVAGTKYRGEFESKIVLLKDFINKTPNVILFIDEIHRTRGAGSVEGGTCDLSGALKPILSRDSAIVIGTTTNEEYNYFIESDKAYKRRFEVIEVKEPKYNEVEAMVKRKVEVLQHYHNVKLSNGVLKFIITASSCFNIEGANPDITLDLCDRAMVVAKLSGSNKVTKRHVKKVFTNSIDLYNLIDKDDIKKIAYHEAAHYVVAKMTRSIYSSEVIAISILPTSSSLGANVIEKKENCVIYDKYLFLDEISTYLAGKAIEEMKFNIVTSGPSNDLEQATYIAKQYISRFGMDKEIGYASYGFNGKILDVSDESINLINSKVNEILTDRYIKAKEILYKNMKLVDMIANALIKNSILVKSDLDKLYNNYLKNKSTC